MNDYDPDLDRLGEDLCDGIRTDIARRQRAPRAEASASRRAGLLRRPRVLAGGTLGLAGLATGLVLALSAGGATAPPAFAITSHSDGSLTINLDDPGQGLVGTNNQLARQGDDEHIQFTMAQGAAPSPGVVPCAASPQGATVSGPPISLTVGPGTSNTETIGSGNTGAGTWHVASCQRYSGAETMHFVSGPDGTARLVTSGSGAPDGHARVLRMRELPIRSVRLRSASTARDSATGPASFNLDTDGGLGGVNGRLAAMGADEHIEFVMAQGPAPATGVVNCVPADGSVTGRAVTVTVGSGDSNTETIASGNTGAGTWHVASCTRFTGADTQAPSSAG